MAWRSGSRKAQEKKTEKGKLSGVLPAKGRDLQSIQHGGEWTQEPTSLSLGRDPAEQTPELDD